MQSLEGNLDAYMVSNPYNDTRQVILSNDDTLEVVYVNLKDNQPDNGHSNIFIAALTTCHARLLVIYTVKPGQPDNLLGDYLGEMTDELDDDGLITSGCCCFFLPYLGRC